MNEEFKKDLNEVLMKYVGELNDQTTRANIYYDIQSLFTYSHKLNFEVTPDAFYSGINLIPKDEYTKRFFEGIVSFVKD